MYAAYLLTHRYPAYGAGLYLETARQIAAHGYALPARIPGYTPGGVPFAYPPLAFYVLAVLIHGVGFDFIAVTRFLPGLLVLAYLVPYAVLAADLTGDRRRAVLATTLLATTPAVLKWHLSAGGVVRSMAFLFALASLAAGLRAFRTHEPRWVALGTGTFALVVLTHPTYTVFVVVSYLVFYLSVDRSLTGFLVGAVVGVGGLVIAAPWWLHVLSVHGPEVFTGAAGSHGGIGAGPAAFVRRLVGPLTRATVHWPFYAVAYLGGFYAVWRRRWFLPAWLLVATFVVGKNRFLFVPGAILASVFVFEVLVPRLEGSLHPSRRRIAAPAVVGAIVLVAVVSGALFGAGAVAGISGTSPAQPQFVHDTDRQAAEWARTGTAPGATFVVLGDAAEWFPYLSGHPILVGSWGAEWNPSADYYAQRERYRSLSTCADATCIARTLDGATVHPDYVYVPKGRYTVYEGVHRQDPSMVASLRASPRFHVVYENDGVVIAAYEDG